MLVFLLMLKFVFMSFLLSEPQLTKISYRYFRGCYELVCKFASKVNQHETVEKTEFAIKPRPELPPLFIS